MRNNKILKIVVILLGIWFVVSFGLSQIIATDYFKNMFWASLAILMAGTLLDLNAWSKIGLDVDKEMANSKAPTPNVLAKSSNVSTENSSEKALLNLSIP